MVKCTVAIRVHALEGDRFTRGKVKATAEIIIRISAGEGDVPSGIALNAVPSIPIRRDLVQADAPELSKYRPSESLSTNRLAPVSVMLRGKFGFS